MGNHELHTVTIKNNVEHLCASDSVTLYWGNRDTMRFWINISQQVSPNNGNIIKGYWKGEIIRGFVAPCIGSFIALCVCWLVMWPSWLPVMWLSWLPVMWLSWLPVMWLSWPPVMWLSWLAVRWLSWLPIIRPLCPCIPCNRAPTCCPCTATGCPWADCSWRE